MLLTEANPDEEFDVETLQHWVKSLQSIIEILEQLQTGQEALIENMKQLVALNEKMNKNLEARLASYETTLLPGSLTEPYRLN